MKINTNKILKAFSYSIIFFLSVSLCFPKSASSLTESQRMFKTVKNI